MPIRRNKRANAYAADGQLRKRLYKGAAIATLGYVGLSLVSFYGQFPHFPYALSVIWAVSLICYTSLKEIFRWNDAEDTGVYHGELWAGIVLAGALWMILWNVGREWIFHMPSIPFPGDYTGATLETIVLYTLSVVSAFLHKSKKHSLQQARKKTRGKKRRVLKSSAIAKNGLVGTESVQNSNPQAVLTKAETLDNKNPPTQKNS